MQSKVELKAQLLFPKTAIYFKKRSFESCVYAAETFTTDEKPATDSGTF